MTVWNEFKSEQFLKKHVAVAKSKLCHTPMEAAQIAQAQLPVILKLISPQALHKTDLGVVRKATTVDEAKKVFTLLKRYAINNNMQFQGILVQEMLQGVELIIGLKKDPTFGHVIAFGLGGIFVETLKDVTFRVCPINEQDVLSMIEDLKGKSVLFGVRGQKPINLSILKKTLIKVSHIPLRHPDITELDINPFIINNTSGKVADARIVCE